MVGVAWRCGFARSGQDIVKIDGFLQDSGFRSVKSCM
jgi:hypothetical protein